jgi:hypothetical protein
MTEKYMSEYHDAFKPPFVEDIVGEQLDREMEVFKETPFQRLLDEYLSMGNE